MSASSSALRSGGEATSNIQSLRSLLLDTQAGVTESSRALLGAAWASSRRILIISNEGLAKVTKLDERRSQDDDAAEFRCSWRRASWQGVRPLSNLRGAVISREGKVTWL